MDTDMDGDMDVDIGRFPVKLSQIYYMYIVSDSFLKNNIIFNTFPYF